MVFLPDWLGNHLKLEELEIDCLSSEEYIGKEFYSCPESVGAGSSTQNGARGVAVTKIFPSLRKLEIRNMEKLLKWSEAGESLSTNVFPCLENFRIEGCSNLEGIPSHFQSVKELEVNGIKSIGAPGELSSLTSLRLQNIHGGEEQIMDVDKLCGNNTSSLRELHMTRCDVFTCLLVGNSCVGLEKLQVWYCRDITSIIISDVQLKSLKSLFMTNCDALEILPRELLQGCTSLQNLSIMNCLALVSLPDMWSPTLKSLKTMEMGFLCEELHHFPAMNIHAAFVSYYSFSSLEEPTLFSFIRMNSLLLDIKHRSALYRNNYF